MGRNVAHFEGLLWRLENNRCSFSSFSSSPSYTLFSFFPLPSCTTWCENHQNKLAIHDSGWGVAGEDQNKELKAKHSEEDTHLEGLPGMENQNLHGVRRVSEPGAAWHVIPEQTFWVEWGGVTWGRSLPRGVRAQARDKDVLVGECPGTKCQCRLKKTSCQRGKPGAGCQSQNIRRATCVGMEGCC